MNNYFRYLIAAFYLSLILIVPSAWADPTIEETLNYINNLIDGQVELDMSSGVLTYACSAPDVYQDCSYTVALKGVHTLKEGPAGLYCDDWNNNCITFRYTTKSGDESKEFVESRMYLFRKGQSLHEYYDAEKQRTDRRLGNALKNLISQWQRYQEEQTENAKNGDPKDMFAK